MTDLPADHETPTPPLTPDQQQLAADNIRLVYLLVHRLQRRRPGLNFDDLVGAGMMGLVQAARCFDPARGVRFSTYACNCIKRHLRIESNVGLIYVPQEAWSHPRLGRWAEQSRAIASLSANPAFFKGVLCSRNHAAQVEADEESQHRRARLYAALNRLDPRDGEVIRLFHLEEISVIEIASRWNVSRERVRQILHRAMSRLKEAFYLVGLQKCG